MCTACEAVNSRKKGITCAGCRRFFHLSCARLTRVQAAAISCRVRPDVCEPPAVHVDFEDYISRCRSGLSVLARVPREAIISAADALNLLLTQGKATELQLLEVQTTFDE